MKECPKCGKNFNWLQRAVGEDKEHLRNCCKPTKQESNLKMAAACRGCPAGCFEGDYREDTDQAENDKPA